MRITPKSFLDNLSIAKKSAILIVTITLGTLLIGVVAHFGVKKIKKSYDIFYQQYYKPIYLLENTKEALQDQKSFANGITKWQKYLKLYYESKTQQDKDLQELVSKTDRLINNIKNLDDRGKVKRLDQMIYKIIEHYNTNANEEYLKSNSVFENTRYLVILLTALVTLITLFLSMLIAKNFKQILTNLANIVEKSEEEIRKKNIEIEEKIDIAVKEARQKDQIIYQNARLASMGEMIANIAHQWRQPLNALTLLIQSFGTKSMTGNLTQEFIDKQVEEGLRLAVSMSDTIEDFRNFFSINREKEYFDLKEAVDSTLDMSSFFLKDENIEIEVDAKEGLKIYGYTNEFSQVLLNLINNARENFKYNGILENKRIFIKVYKSQDYIKVDFIDNGGGINENIIHRIFEPYFTTKHKSIGTGIGLYMSKQIIETQMNGKIEAENIDYTFDDKDFRCAKFTITFFEQ